MGLFALIEIMKKYTKETVAKGVAKKLAKPGNQDELIKDYISGLMQQVNGEKLALLIDAFLNTRTPEQRNGIEDICNWLYEMRNKKRFRARLIILMAVSETHAIKRTKEGLPLFDDQLALKKINEEHFELLGDEQS